MSNMGEGVLEYESPSTREKKAWETDLKKNQSNEEIREYIAALYPGNKFEGARSAAKILFPEESEGFIQKATQSIMKELMEKESAGDRGGISHKYSTGKEGLPRRYID